MGQGIGTQKFFFSWGPGGNSMIIIDNLLHFVLFVGTAPYPRPRCVQSWFSGKAMAS